MSSSLLPPKAKFMIGRTFRSANLRPDYVWRKTAYIHVLTQISENTDFSSSTSDDEVSHGLKVPGAKGFLRQILALFCS